MYGPAGWTHTAGVPRLAPVKNEFKFKGKGAGSGRFSGYGTKARQREYHEKREFEGRGKTEIIKEIQQNGAKYG